MTVLSIAKFVLKPLRNHATIEQSQDMPTPQRRLLTSYRNRILPPPRLGFFVTQALYRALHRRFAPTALASALLACWIAPTAWAQQAHGDDDDKAAVQTVEPAESTSSATVSDPEARFHIMAGEMAAARNEPGLAAAEFLAALRKVDDPALAARATGLAFTAGSANLVQQAAQRWLELDANNMDPREVLLAMDLQRNEVEGAYTQAKAIVDGHGGGRDEGFRHVGVLMVQQPGKNDTAIAVLDRLTNDYPKESGAYYATALLALRQDRVDAAETAIRKAVELNSDSRENVLLLVGVLVRAGKLDESDARIEALTKKHPKESADMRMAYAKLLVESQQRDRARQQVERILKADSKNKDARYALAVFQLNDNELDAARKQFELLSKDIDRGSDARFQLGRIAEQQKRYDDALGLYDSVNSGPQALDAAVRRAAVLARLGRIGEARDTLHRVRDQFPPLRERLLLAEGEMLLTAGKRDEALAAYNEGLRELPGNDDLLYGRSLVFDQLGRTADAEADLRSILKTKPDDARALNALGYMLSNGNKDRLPEARDLIEKAMKLEPEDPAIIDSLGWINFKLGKAETAKDLLVKAHGITPDPEIAAHLGEVLWTLGQRDQAKAVWSAALKGSPDHEVLKETIQRLSP